MIETRAVDTGNRTLDIPTVNGVEIRSVGPKASLRGGLHPGYRMEQPDWEYRADADQESQLDDSSIGRFVGHPAVFDVPAWIGPPQVGFQEVVSKSAFSKTLSDGADVRFVHNHNPDLLLGRTSSDTLRLTTDRLGLFAEALMANTSYSRDIATLLDRGDISQMSFAFRAIKEQWETLTRDSGEEFERRTLLEVALVDVSTVTWPAYDQTDAQLLRTAYASIGANSANEKCSIVSNEQPRNSTEHVVTMPIDVAAMRVKINQRMMSKDV